MAKQIQSRFRMKVPAGQASAQPPIGPTLGAKGLNIVDFCKTFNAQTAGMEPGVPVPTEVLVYADRSYTVVTKPPEASFLIKRAANVERGSGNPSTEQVGTVTRAQLEEIAKIKDA